MDQELATRADTQPFFLLYVLAPPSHFLHQPNANCRQSKSPSAPLSQYHHSCSNIDYARPRARRSRGATRSDSQDDAQSSHVWATPLSPGGFRLDAPPVPPPARPASCRRRCRLSCPAGSLQPHRDYCQPCQRPERCPSGRWRREPQHVRGQPSHHAIHCRSSQREHARAGPPGTQQEARTGPGARPDTLALLRRHDLPRPGDHLRLHPAQPFPAYRGGL